MIKLKCPKCQKTKPNSDFYVYEHSTSSYCKECMRLYSNGRREKKKEPRSTRDVRKLLNQQGIPCTTGRAIGHKWMDLAAWGCIPIEAKGAEIQPSVYGCEKLQWAFTAKQVDRGFPPHGLFVFIAYRNEFVDRVFIVPMGETWVYKHDKPSSKRRWGKTKRSLTITVGSNHGNASLWSKIQPFEDAYYLVESARIKYSQGLLGMED